MGTQKPRYSKDEFARRGERIYEQDIHPHLTPEDEGKFVLIDIETGAYEIDEDELVASDRLLARFPTAQVWIARVGFRAARIRLLSKQRKTPRRLGTAKGQVTVPPEFFDPLPEEILRPSGPQFIDVSVTAVWEL